MAVKRSLRNDIFLPVLLYVSETFILSKAEQSKVQALEMNYQRWAYGVTRWWMRAVNVYEICSMRRLHIIWSVEQWIGWKKIN